MHDDRALGDGRLDLGAPGPDPRVDDRLEPPAGLGVAEHDRAERRSVQLAVLGEHVRAERIDDLRESARARSDDLAGELVGVDHHGSQLGEQGRDRALPRGDSPGQSYSHEMSLERQGRAYALCMTRRLGLLLALALLPLMWMGAAQADPNDRQVSITGDHVVGTYPTYDTDVDRFGVRTDSTDESDITVTVSGVSPSAYILVDKIYDIEPDRPTVFHALKPGDTLTILIDDQGLTTKQSWVFLPPGFPEISTAGPTTGTPVFVGLVSYGSSHSFQAILDRGGVPYRAWEAPEPNDFRAQPQAGARGPAYTMFEPVKESPDDTEYGYRVLEMNSRFEVVGTRRLVPDRIPGDLPLTPDDTDFYDVQYLPDGRVILVGYHRDFHQTESPWLDAIIQIQTPDGLPLFTWSSARYIHRADARVLGAKGEDYAHINSVDYQPNGDIVASFRNTGEVLRIATKPHDGYQSGQVIWRLGGNRNEFTFVDDPFGGFCAQHDARILPNGHLSVFDNGSRRDTTGPGAPQTADMCPAPAGGDLVARAQSRVAEYRLNTRTMTATLVHSFVPTGRYSPFAGNAQRLDSGNTFVGWANTQQSDGTPPFASEVAPDGEEVWSASAPGWFSYRAFTQPIAPSREVTLALNNVKSQGPNVVRAGAKPFRVYLSIDNRGSAHDRFRVQQKRVGRFDVRYRFRGKDVTAAVRHGGWVTPSIRRREGITMMVVVRRGHARHGSQHLLRVRATSLHEWSTTALAYELMRAK